MKWISVKDRYPRNKKEKTMSSFDMDGFHPGADEEGIYVLTYSPVWHCKVAVYSSEEDCWHDADDVTHWMELPEAPKEE